MSPLRFAVLGVAMLLLAVPVLALPRNTPADREYNRTKLQKIREQDPDKLAQLYQQAQAFLALPAGRAEQLRQLDQDLHELPRPYRKHLKQVLTSYAAWLNQLPPEQRKKIEQAPNKDARLELIKQLREQQWENTLPKSDRDRLADMQGQERHKEIVRLKQLQFKWNVEWQLAMLHWGAFPPGKINEIPAQLPRHIDDLYQDSKPYVKDFLRNIVPSTRWKELENADGQWPWFPYLLVKLADDYPLALPGSEKWPLRLSDLPKEIVARLKKSPDHVKKLAPLEGQWPNFASKVAELFDRQTPGLLRFELWPTQYKELSPAVRTFVDKDLKEVLTPKDDELLKQAEGRWPDYPLKIQELARKYYLAVPWQSLPVFPNLNLWDSYRIKKGLTVEKLPAAPPG